MTIANDVVEGLQGPTLQYWTRGQEKHPRTVKLPSQGTFVVGREPLCNLTLDDGKVSRRHAELHVHASLVRLFDVDSQNGTTVNGKPVSEAWLHHGDVVKVGDTILTVYYQTLEGLPTDPEDDNLPVASDGHYGKLRAAIVALDVRYDGNLRAVKRKVLDPELVRAVGLRSTRHLQRLLRGLSLQLGVGNDIDGSDLVAQLADVLQDRRP